MKVRECWADARDALARCGIADASIEAEVLIRTALCMERADFVAALNTTLSRDRARQVDGLVQRRTIGEPLAYIAGHREFYGLDFLVDSRVLIPRQETELLVDQVLEFSDSLGGPPLEVADVGTGSGAIAITIAHHLPAATVYAADSSGEALTVADMNRRRHGVTDRVRLCPGDLFEALPGPVDVIVSNPPYVASDELLALPTEIQWEPRRALEGGPDGLAVTTRLLRGAPSCLHPGGRLVLEIAPQQLEAASKIAVDSFPGGHISFERDLAGLPRAIIIDTRESKVEGPVNIPDRSTEIAPGQTARRIRV